VEGPLSRRPGVLVLPNDLSVETPGPGHERLDAGQQKFASVLIVLLILTVCLSAVVLWRGAWNISRISRGGI